jgi:hypothetical protein
MLVALGCREKRSNNSDAMATDQVDLDTRFVQRSQDSGVVGSRGAGAGQNKSCAKLR